jgi:hypothetical protein
VNRFLEDPRNPVRVLGAAMVLAAVLILLLGRGVGFTGDEAVFVAEAPNLGLRQILDPHGGHLLATTRVVYRAILEVNGMDYLPFRLLSLATVLITVWLLFVWARRRVDPWVALLPCLVLLFFGADHLHSFHGNGFTVLSSVAFGLAALICFERGDRRGDVLACAFLILGVLSYSIILAFIAGIGLLIVKDRRSWPRLWVVLAPVGLYLLWRIWMVTADVETSGSDIELVRILVVPAWSFQALDAVLAALSGLGYPFAGFTEHVEHPVGSALAVSALALLGWSIYKRGIGETLAMTLVVALALWAMQALAAGEVRVPGDSRYMYPAAVAVMLVAFAAVGPSRPPTRLLALLAVATVSAIAVNVMVLSDGATFTRDYSKQIRASAGVFRLVGTADRNADTSTQIGVLSAMADSPFGEFGSGPGELYTRPESERQFLDAVIGRVGAFGAVQDAGSCRPGRRVSPEEISAGGPVRVVSPTGGKLIAGLLADEPTFELATLAPGAATLVDLPDFAGLPWKLTAPGADLRICRAGTA